MRREVELSRHEWWTMWGGDQFCSSHSSFAAAKRAIYECERRGGSEHILYKVQLVSSWRGKPYRKGERKP
jgi:hypothetical protein